MAEQELSIADNITENLLYDDLVDTEVNIDVLLGNTQITIREFLQLTDGDLLSLDKLAGEGGDVYVNGRAVGIGDVVVIDELLAVRIQEVMDADSIIKHFYEESMGKI
jgi:flagellar motor switch protein FliN/FliY